MALNVFNQISALTPLEQANHYNLLFAL